MEFKHFIYKSYKLIFFRNNLIILMVKTHIKNKFKQTIN